MKSAVHDSARNHYRKWRINLLVPKQIVLRDRTTPSHLHVTAPLKFHNVKVNIYFLLYRFTNIFNLCHCVACIQDLLGKSYMEFFFG